MKKIILFFLALIVMGNFFFRAQVAGAQTYDECVKAKGCSVLTDPSLKAKCESNCKSAPSPATPAPSAPAAGGSSSSTDFPNPIGFNTINDVLTALLNHLQGILAVIAVIFIVLGGIFYMFAGVDSKMVETAKRMWTGAVIGFAIVLAAPTFLREITIIFGKDNGTGLRAIDIATNILNLLLSIVGILAIITLVYAGGTIMTAYGDPKRMEEGKNTAKWAIIGIAVALAAVVILKQVARIMGAQ